jgi:hypothetical protein
MPKIPTRGETVKLNCDVCHHLFEFMGDGTGWIPTTCPACKEKMGAEIRREQLQYRIWADGFLAKLRRAGSLTLAHRHIPDYIATLTADGERWRLTTWRPNGPGGHELYSAADLAHEVYLCWWVDPTAPARMDSWVNTPAWKLGMAQLEYLEIWNAFSADGNSAACHAMDEAAFGPGGLEAGIARGRELSNYVEMKGE